MTNLERRWVPLCYLAIALAFISFNLSGPPDGAVSRWPEFKFGEVRHFELREWDREVLQRSIQRLPSVRWMRMLGKSLRILLGQRLPWIVYGSSDQRPVLAPRVELGISVGLNDPGIKANLDHLIRRLGQYSSKLKDEGWELIIVPVPTKLSIYREAFNWPIANEGAQIVRQGTRDGADALNAYMKQQLDTLGVCMVDLNTSFRTLATSSASEWLYPPGESHWSGHGLDIAAQKVAAAIDQKLDIGDGLQQPVTEPFPVVHIGDIMRSMDAFPGLLGRFRSIYGYEEILKVWPEYQPQPTDAAISTLVVVLGTSYTGQYGWIPGKRVGFAQAIGAYLPKAEIIQISQTGVGGFHSFVTFQERKWDLLNEYRNKLGGVLPEHRRFVIWEFPIRDFGYLTAESGSRIAHFASRYGAEQHMGHDLRWLGPDGAVLDIFACEDGHILLTAAIHPGPAIRNKSQCRLALRNEVGEEVIVNATGQSVEIPLEVRAGLNRFTLVPASPMEIPPPYSNGDNRELMISLFNLQLVQK